METIEKKEYTKEEKINFMLFKDYIKELANGQKDLKNQRKTLKLVGERTMSPDMAASNHQYNRERLRVLYAAYGILKGKKYSEIENKYPEENHPLQQYERSIERVLVEHKFLNEEE